MASSTHGWLQTSAAVSSCFRRCTQHTCVPDRDSCNRQNFSALRSVSMHCCFSADGYGLRTWIRLELSGHSAIRKSMALPASVPKEPIKAQTAYTEPPVIDLHGLSVSFGRRQILKNLRGDLRGKAIGLLGPNGAGKTTLIHTLLGFHPPSAGTAQILVSTSSIRPKKSNR